MHASLLIGQPRAPLVLLALLLGTSGVHACSCMEPPAPEIALSEATAVFVGKVIDMQPSDPSTEESIQFGVNNVLFEVRQAWKGVESARITIHTLNSLAACGYPFKVGQEYLVYATGKVGDLYVYQCSRTQHIPGENSELEVTEEPAFLPEDEDWPPLRLMSEHPIPVFLSLAALVILVAAYLRKSRG